MQRLFSRISIVFVVDTIHSMYDGEVSNTVDTSGFFKIQISFHISFTEKCMAFMIAMLHNGLMNTRSVAKLRMISSI